MARHRFIAPGHEGHICIVFGRAFPHGEWVDTAKMDAEHVERLSVNPTFEAEAPAKAPKRPAEAAS